MDILVIKIVFYGGKGQESYDFIYMWDIKQKSNKQTKEANSETEWWSPEGEGGRRKKRQTGGQFL